MAIAGFKELGPFQQAALDSLFGLSQNLTNQVEKFTRLNLEMGVQSTRESLTAVQALLEVKDAEALGKWHETYFQPGLDRASEGARKHYEVLLETRSLLADAIKQSAVDATKLVHSTLDEASEGAPEGFEAVFEAIRTGLNAQLAALDSVSKVSEHISEIAEANVFALKTVTEPVVKARSAAKRKAA